MMLSFELTAIDRHFADFIVRQSRMASPMLRKMAAFLSCRVQQGDICLDLADIADQEIRSEGKTALFPRLDVLLEILRDSPTVGLPGDFKPLVLDGAGRLYLYRYWRYEHDLAGVVLQKAASGGETIDQKLLARGLARLFPQTAAGEADWQKAAALAALRGRISIISGGPGTGKTSTVVRIIALLLEQAQGAPLRIALAAPTGKSASRLREASSLMLDALLCDSVIKELIPREVSTIHRLLGTIPGSVRFRYSRANPMPYDVVVIDEASMVALPLMSMLLLALKPEARLIILGDRDQLASVEAGAALGDLCGNGRRELFSAEFAAQFSDLTGERITAVHSALPLPPLADRLVVLRKNYRFSAGSGIGAAGRAVNDGRGAEAMAILNDRAFPDAVWRELPAADGLRHALKETVSEGYGAFLHAETATEALRLFASFRILCALNRGSFGVERINGLVEEILSAAGLIDAGQRWYRGRPVIVAVNDYNLRLFNGDIGIVFPSGDADGSLRVYFPDADGGGVRGVSPARLPAHETCYAMTIHKSQGSEFDHIEMILPSGDAAIMTRELIYTGITRARSGVKIWGKEDVFVSAVSRRTERKSGLREALWDGGRHPV